MRVLIVDDHLLFAEAVRHSLAEAAFEVVGLAPTAGDGLRAIDETRPDLVLVDIGLPDQSGLALGRAVLERFPETNLVALTALDDARTVREAMEIGFRGYITKDIEIARFVDAVVAALGDAFAVSDGRGPNDKGERRRRAAARADDAKLVYHLTARELEVLELLVAGESGGAIAEALSITPNTVRSHIQSILTKLQVHSRLEAAAFAVRHRLVASRFDRTAS